jgi:cyclopropane fatty-acyl-phospholipid synthase-like methyltransferase
MTSSQYDAIAKEYAEGQNERANRVYLYDPSFLEVAGDLEGKTILDLACGDGRMSRQAALRGARRVVGVDLSSKMIKIAKDKEKKNPLGIEYRIGKVGELGKIGEFDQVWGTFLLHYAQTKEELKAMCGDIAANLKSGGRFVALNQNPLCPFSPTANRKYGSTIFPEGPLFEGQRIKVTLWQGEKEGASFYNYHWNCQTYNESLWGAGLREVRLRFPTVSPEGIEKFGEEFWAGAKQYPTVGIISATK